MRILELHYMDLSSVFGLVLDGKILLRLILGRERRFARGHVLALDSWS